MGRKSSDFDVAVVIILLTAVFVALVLFTGSFTVLVDAFSSALEQVDDWNL
jgi:hypothetical protein